MFSSKKKKKKDIVLSVFGVCVCVLVKFDFGGDGTKKKLLYADDAQTQIKGLSSY